MSSISSMMSNTSKEGKAGLFSSGAGLFTTIIGGIAEREAAETKANYILEEGQFAYESYIAEAARTRENANKYQANQTMKYVMSGVSIQGTPMLALQYTSQQSRLEVEALEVRAARTKRLAQLNASAVRQEAKYSSYYRLGKSVTGMFDAIGRSGIFNQDEDPFDTDTSIEGEVGDWGAPNVQKGWDIPEYRMA